MAVTYTPGRTWVAGQNIRNWQLNRDIRENQRFVRSPPGCTVLRTTDQVVADGAWTTLEYTTGDTSIDRNPSGIFDPSSPTKFTLPYAGLWRITAAGTLESNVDIDRMLLRLRWNNSTGAASKCDMFGGYNAGATAAGTVRGVTLAYTDAGDFFEVEFNHNGSGGDLNMNQSRIDIEFLTGVGTTPTWTTPRTWVDGAADFTAAIMNAHIRDNSDYFYYRPAAVVGIPTNQTLTNTIWTTASMTASPNLWLNNNSIWSSANPNRITPGVAGRYLIFAKALFAAGTTTGVGLRLIFNGNELTTAPLTSQRPPVNQRACLTGVAEIKMGATDYVELQACQHSGSSKTIIAAGGALGAGTHFGVVWSSW